MINIERGSRVWWVLMGGLLLVVLAVGNYVVRVLLLPPGLLGGLLDEGRDGLLHRLAQRLHLRRVRQLGVPQDRNARDAVGRFRRGVPRHPEPGLPLDAHPGDGLTRASCGPLPYRPIETSCVRNRLVVNGMSSKRAGPRRCAPRAAQDQ